MENENLPQIEYFDGNRLVINAPAKINLSLLIGPKRSDGYHEVHTVMAKINLCDKLVLEKCASNKIELVCNGKYFAPETSDNLVCRAANLLGISSGVKITLTKNIPAGAGLAGGSSDAASTLIGLNKLYKLGHDENKLRDYASQIGSDIPFFIGHKLALCTGRGEKIENIFKNYNFTALLFLPNVNSSTKEVYKNFKPDAELFEKKKVKINEYIRKNRIDLITKMCANMLANSCFELYPELADLKRDVETLLSGSVCLSGSGSSIYAIPDENEIIDINKLKEVLHRKVNCSVEIVSNNRW